MLSTHTPLWTKDRGIKSVDSLNNSLRKNMFCCGLLQRIFRCPNDSRGGLMTRTSREVSVTSFLLANSRILWKSHSHLLLSLVRFIPMKKSTHECEKYQCILHLWKVAHFMWSQSFFFDFKGSRTGCQCLQREYKNNP